MTGEIVNCPAFHQPGTKLEKQFRGQQVDFRCKGSMHIRKSVETLSWISNGARENVLGSSARRQLKNQSSSQIMCLTLQGLFLQQEKSTDAFQRSLNGTAMRPLVTDDLYEITSRISGNKALAWIEYPIGHLLATLNLGWTCQLRYSQMFDKIFPACDRPPNEPSS